MVAPAELIVDHFLFPGDIFVGVQPTRVQTILGSCVAVCLYDPALGIGGMNHFMLPMWSGQGLQSPKYGDIAMSLLIDKLLRNGSRRQNLVAKIFGGANQIATAVESMNVGARNIAIS